MSFPYYGKTQSWDNAWDVGAMSNYNTITSLAESPKQEGLLYAGTDDGLIQVTENEGVTWKKVVLNSVKGVGIIHLDDKDVIRHRLVKKVIAAYKAIENND